MQEMIKRHDRMSIFMHWFNAVCWILLLLTGIALIQNPFLNPIGSWWPEWVRSALGGGAKLLDLHIIIGFIWIIGFILYIILNFKGTAFFLKEIFTPPSKQDLEVTSQ